MLFKFMEFIFVFSLELGTFCRRTNVLAEIPRPLSEGKGGAVRGDENNKQYLSVKIFSANVTISSPRALL